MSNGPWIDAENDLIVADYFAMLAADVAGQPYNKAAHNRDLQARIDRNRSSIEFKHQNISAALQGLGETWIPGYKPAVNLQMTLVDAVARWLALNPAWLGRTPSALLGRRCVMADWTRTMVEDRIETAADVFRALPGVRPQGYSNAWPEYFHSFGDKVAQQPETRRPHPGPRAITEAEAALLWLRWLEPQDARLVWLRANRTAWKPICWEFGISRATANRRWEYGLSVICWRLNGKRVPAKRSMDHVIQRAR